MRGCLGDLIAANRRGHCRPVAAGSVARADPASLEGRPHTGLRPPDTGMRLIAARRVRSGPCSFLCVSSPPCSFAVRCNITPTAPGNPAPAPAEAA